MLYARLKTTLGDIVLKLDSAAAPRTVENFVQYVRDGHYNGAIFHRVIAGFMIQGGGMDRDLVERETRPAIPNEAQNGLKNEKYAVAMARTQEPHSATSQFFINTKNNEFLNFTSETPRGWGYAVFGQVVEGAEVVDAIEGVETTTRSYYEDVPAEPVLIEEAEMLDNYHP